MVKAEWGQKRICQHCGARFYDMRRAPIICPKCSTEFDPAVQLRPRRAREEPARPVPVPTRPSADEDALPVEAEIEEDLEEAVDEEEKEDAIEDASELGEDEDDVAEVLDNVDEEDDR